MMTTLTRERPYDLIKNQELYDSPYYRRLLEKTVDAALKSTDDDHEAESRAFDMFHVVRQLMSIVNNEAAIDDDNDADDEAWIKKAKGWRHMSRFTFTDPTNPVVPINEASALAGHYLAQDLRVDALDRVIVDIVMAAEMTTFGTEQRENLKPRNLILSALWGNLVSFVVGMGLTGVLIWLFPNSTVMMWIAAIIAGLTILGTAVSLIIFPFVYPEARNTQKRIQGIVAGMRDAYSTLAGEPASIAHVAERVAKATDAGVVWPAPLHVLIEDIAERRKTI